MLQLLLCVVVAASLPAVAAAADSAEPPQVVTIVAPRDAEWAAYRHAYKANAMFAAHVRTRPLIQAHMQIRPRDAASSLAGLRLQLTGESVNADIAVDGIGRAVLPLSTQAYEEDAVLRLNRRQGHYYFSGRYSVRERDDGRYGAADLRAACEQLIGAQRASGSRLRLLGRSCTGIKFVYDAAGAAPTVEFRGAQGQGQALPVSVAHPFEDNTMGMYQVATYRFADWPADGTISTRARPLAIGTLYD